MRKIVEKHGDYGTRLFYIYNNMKQRCVNQNFKQYKDYGGRGIYVCEEWKNSYLAFKKWAMSNGYSDILTIDRIDNGLGYSPNNCQWIGHYDQKLNTRIRSDNTSGYKGVSYRKDTKKFTAYLWVHGKRILLGCYFTPIEAVMHRNAYIIENETGHKIQGIQNDTN